MPGAARGWTLPFPGATQALDNATIVTLEVVCQGQSVGEAHGAGVLGARPGHAPLAPVRASSAQHLLLALADDSDYEDSAWEEELASPAGQMADKVSVGAGRGRGGEQENAGPPTVMLVLGCLVGTAWGWGGGAGCSASPRSCCFPGSTKAQPPRRLACTECVLVDSCSITAYIYCLDLGFLSSMHSLLRPNSCGSGPILGAAAP